MGFKIIYIHEYITVYQLSCHGIPYRCNHNPSTVNTSSKSNPQHKTQQQNQQTTKALALERNPAYESKTLQGDKEKEEYQQSAVQPTYDVINLQQCVVNRSAIVHGEIKEEGHYNVLNRTERIKDTLAGTVNAAED